VWGTDRTLLEKKVPSEIPMTGMGMFACETENWPEISPHFKGFGAEEWYIQEKFRRNGGKCICIPEAKWVHRFARPNGVPFPNNWEDRIRNYYIGWFEVYNNDPMHPMITSIDEHFSQFIPITTVQNIKNSIKYENYYR
jgi:hypothetical protein